eukprot:6469161-Amphidinium_carterae.7
MYSVSSVEEFISSWTARARDDAPSRVFAPYSTAYWSTPHARCIRSQYSLTTRVAIALRKTVGIIMGLNRLMASVVVSLRSATVALVLNSLSTVGGRSSDRYLVQSTWTTSMVRGCWAIARKFSCDQPLASSAFPSLNASSILPHLRVDVLDIPTSHEVEPECCPWPGRRHMTTDASTPRRRVPRRFEFEWLVQLVE